MKNLGSVSDAKDITTVEWVRAITGSLANLLTTQKSNLVAAINEVAAGGGGGGGGSYVVTISNNGGVISADKTVAEIKAAIDAGMQIVLTGDIYYDAANASALVTELEGVTFVGLSFTDGDYIYVYSGMTLGGQDTWEYTELDIPSTHNELLNRDVADCHPMSAITGLESALGGKQAAFSTGDGLSMVNNVLSLDLDNYDGGAF